MALHFDRSEFLERQGRARARMAEAGLDGLVIFRQESMYYPTGYDTSDYSIAFFDCKTEQAFASSDHTILIGRLLDYEYDSELAPSYTFGATMTLSIRHAVPRERVRSR